MVIRRRADDRAVKTAMEVAEEGRASRTVEIEGEAFANYPDAEGAAEKIILEMKGDNERARFTLMVEGKPYSSKDAVSKAIRDALGEVEALPLELADGMRFRRISTAGSTIAQLLNSAIVDGEETVDLGMLKGLPLKAYIGPEEASESAGQGALGIDKPVRAITLMVEGRHIRDALDLMTDKATGTASPASIASVISSLSRSIGHGSSGRHLESRLQSAQNDLPALEAQAGKPFPMQDVFETKRARLEELASVLAAEGKQQAGATSATEAPSVLRASLGSGVDFEPISLEDAAGVLAQVRPTAQEVWNVELRLSPTHAALPQDVQDEVAKDYGPDERPNGVLHKGVVYLVADAHGSVADLEETILHEVKGHVAARRFYGADITRELNKLFLQIGGNAGISRIAEARGIERLGDYASALATS